MHTIAQNDYRELCLIASPFLRHIMIIIQPSPLKSVISWLGNQQFMYDLGHGRGMRQGGAVSLSLAELVLYDQCQYASAKSESALPRVETARHTEAETIAEAWPKARRRGGPYVVLPQRQASPKVKPNSSLQILPPLSEATTTGQCVSRPCTVKITWSSVFVISPMYSSTALTLPGRVYTTIRPSTAATDRLSSA